MRSLLASINNPKLVLNNNQSEMLRVDGPIIAKEDLHQCVSQLHQVGGLSNPLPPLMCIYKGNMSPDSLFICVIEAFSFK